MKFHLLTAATCAALALTAGAASAQDLTSEKGKVSYALGYRAGLDIARVVESGEQLDMETLIKALQDASRNKEPAVPREALGAALQGLQERMAAKARADLGKRAAENKAKGDTFLAQNKGKPGVTVLPSGVQYRELESGSGPKPTEANQVTIEFRNTLPDGTVIADTSMASVGQPAGPVTLRVSEIPYPGLREALVRMPAGARWEVVLPGNTAHGTAIESAGEMANQVVIVNIKLRSVGPAVAAPQKP